jgi:hypothetical protein
LVLLFEEEEEEEESDDFEEPFELESLDDGFESLEEEDGEELSLFLELSFSFISRERFFVP